MKALEDTPQVLPYALLYWDAYCALTRTRVWMEGRPLAIPLTEVEAYTRIYNWDPEQTETLLFVIDRLEAVYFDWHAKESQKKSRRGGAGRKPRPTKP